MDRTRIEPRFTIIIRTENTAPELELQTAELRDKIAYWFPMLEHLSASGFELEVVTPFKLASDEGLPFCHTYMPSWTIAGLGPWKLGSVAKITSPRLLWTLIANQSRVLISVEYGFSTVWAFCAARLTGKKLWIFQEAARSKAVRSKSQLRRLIARFLANRADLVLGNSPIAVRDAISNLGVESSKVIEVPLLSAPPRSYLLRDTYALPEGSSGKTLLAVSQLIPRKNIAILLKAAERMKHQGLDFRLWLVGSGPLGEELMAMSDSLGLEGIVEFLGAVPYPAMGHLYQAADIFVFPTLHDLYGISALEAMRFGKPLVISSAAGIVGDLVVHDENALVFDPHDLDELVASLTRVILENDLLRRLSKNAEKKVLEYSQEAVSARLWELVR